MEKFRNMCTEYQRQITYIEEIEDSHPLGICYIQLKDLKETAMPEPQRLLSIVHLTMPW